MSTSGGGGGANGHALPACLSDPEVRGLFDLLPEARLVGGVVRDFLIGRDAADIDLASPLPPETVMARLTGAGLRVVPTGLGHGTVTAVLSRGPVEITTLRRDVETDGRHAVVAFTNDWREDAARRDFTINAMSMAPDGTLYDYFGGQQDLAAGVVRFVGDPAQRVAEDYLRVLRFFRFFARFGKAPPDAATEAALRGSVPHLANLSAERVWSELKRVLAASDPLASMRLMDAFAVLDAVVPEGTDVGALAALLEAGAPMDPLLRLGKLLTGDAAAFADRLHLSTAERERLITERSGPVPRPGDSDAVLRRALADTPADTLINRTWLTGDNDPAWHAVRAKLARMRPPVFPLEGRDVVALGVPPGPAVGALLRTVRGWWLDGGCAAGTEACRAELERLVRDKGAA